MSYDCTRWGEDIILELADKQVKLEFISPEKGSGLYEEIKLSMGDERE